MVRDPLFTFWPEPGMMLPERRGAMFIAQVVVQVKAEAVEAFKTETLENARNSVREPGVARFDVLQQQDDPTRFVLSEVYRTPADAGKHKETAHYARWRCAVADMMAAPRTSILYDSVFPDDKGWDFR